MHTGDPDREWSWVASVMILKAVVVDDTSMTKRITSPQKLVDSGLLLAGSHHFFISALPFRLFRVKASSQQCGLPFQY